MLLDFHPSFKWLSSRLHHQPSARSVLPECVCPLAHPDAALPAWVEADPLVAKYRALLGDLPWAQFPERSASRAWPGPPPHPRAPFVAAFLIKLHEGKRFMSELRSFLLEHPALVCWLGFARLPDPASPFGFDLALSVPDRRQFSRVLRTLPNDALQFLLSASIAHLRASLAPDEQAGFGECIAGDTQALLAWVRENNPKQFIPDGRLDKARQPSGDPDCKLGIKKRRNSVALDADEQPTPTTDALPFSRLQIGVEILWGYASGIVTTRLPDHTEVVLAERTRPFNEDDITHFFPLMQQVEARLGRRPRFGAWDCAFDAHYVYDYFHQAGGFAAVPINPGKRGSGRRFAPDGAPLCAADLAMTLQFRYLHRADRLPHERGKYRCPLLYPSSNGQECPIADAHFAKGGCTSTIAMSAGARIRHLLDRHSAEYKQLYALRTMVERINAQAEALGILHPKLRRGSAIANQNTLTYLLLNLRALTRRRAASKQARQRAEVSALAA